MSREYAVGDKVRLLKNIYEDECDGLIPGHYLAFKGEQVEVREVGGVTPAQTQRIYVAHAMAEGSFAVYQDEIEPV